MRLGLRDLVAKAKPGECPFCGDPRAEGRTKPHLTCGDEICKTAYQRYWKRDQRHDEGRPERRDSEQA